MWRAAREAPQPVLHGVPRAGRALRRESEPDDVVCGALDLGQDVRGGFGDSKHVKCAWVVHSGQFDDLEGPAHRILMNDNTSPQAPDFPIRTGRRGTRSNGHDKR
jgi:hypothetical protein